MVIFHSYVSLPEGKQTKVPTVNLSLCKDVFKSFWLWSKTPGLWQFPSPKYLRPTTPQTLHLIAEMETTLCTKLHRSNFVITIMTSIVITCYYYYHYCYNIYISLTCNVFCVEWAHPTSPMDNGVPRHPLNQILFSIVIAMIRIGAFPSLQTPATFVLYPWFPISVW